MTIGRNDPCPCGSGKKYKKCCVNKVKSRPKASIGQLLSSIKDLSTANQLTPAINKCLEALKLEPNNTEVNLIAGKLYTQANRPDMAERFLRKAISIQPNNVDALRILAVLLNQSGNSDESLAVMRKAYKLAPSDLEISTNFATFIMNTDNFDDAEDLLIKSRSSDAGNPSIHYNLGHLYRKQFRHQDAVNSYKKAIELAPNNFKHKHALIRAIDYCPNFPIKEGYNTLKQTGEFIEQRFPSLFPQYKQTKKLRIGYLGTTLRQHSVAHFLLPILSTHSKDIEVYCYHTGEKEDEVTERIRQSCTQYRHLYGNNSVASSKIIHDDSINILFDLDGYTSTETIEILSLQPAPVQISWIGYPDTTGLTRVKYRITDEYTDPVNSVADSIHTETLIRMPQCFSIYSPLKATPEPQPAPAIKNGYVTFGSFNETSKLNEDVVGLWAKILLQVPNSKLVLKHFNFNKKSTRDNLIKMFSTAGINQDNLTLLGPDKTTDDHLKRYHEIDIALDPYPFNGATTTCEALWMGVPVISLAGEKHMSRVSAGILNTIDCPSFIASSKNEYLETAKNTASNLYLLNKTRLGLRKKMQQSPLMNAETFTPVLEEKLRKIALENDIFSRQEATND